MAEDYGAKDSIKCSQCGAGMYVVRRSSHPGRPEYEKQIFEGSNCQHSMTRIVDSAGRPLR
jgi:hypothetical protein